MTQGVISDVQVRFVDENGEDKPIKGRTQDYIITREMQLKPGVVFNRKLAQKDLQKTYSGCSDWEFFKI